MAVKLVHDNSYNMANYHGCIIFATIIYLTYQVVDDVQAGIMVGGSYLSANDLPGEGNEEFEKLPVRNIRAPAFQLHEISTARGYGKRNVDYSLNGWESHLLDKLIGYQDNKRGSAHGIDLREPRLRFRMENDGSLRIGRGFGKRSTLNHGQKEECKTN